MGGGGGSPATWRYTAFGYDEFVAMVCGRLSCRDGSAELAGVAIGDAIGHVRPSSVGQLCHAVVSWLRAAVAQVPIRARL